MMQEFKYNFSPVASNFIDVISNKFPEKEITSNFLKYMKAWPEQRLSMALEERKKVKRKGWNRRGVPLHETETIEEHVQGMKIMATSTLGHHPDLPIILDIIECHDTGESIIGDFDKEDKKNITKLDKQRLECLAVQLIYESKPDMVDRWWDFEHRREFAGKFSADMDAAQMCERRLAYAVTHPHIDLSEFDDYFEKLEWHTKEGKAIYQKLTCR